MSMNATPTDILPRLMEKVWQEDNSGCWIWTGTITSGGNGMPRPRVSINGRQQLAYRVMFSVYHKCSLLPKTFICHHCDNSICCNPDHLFAGNEKTNREDSILKGRASHQKNRASWSAKIIRGNLNRPYKNSTGFRGVSQERSGNYAAQIKINGKLVRIGTFKTAQKAHRAWLNKLEKLKEELK